MKTSTIILAGGKSERLGQEKGLVPLVGKYLIQHVLERVEGISDEIIVVVSSESQKESYSRAVGNTARLVVDRFDVRSPLVGAMAGFEAANGEKALLLPCDAPFISREVASFLLDVCRGKAAAIPRWPDGKIEPLHAAYDTEMGFKAAEKALKNGKFDMRSMISELKGVRYISTLVIRKLDPKLLTFFNVNTPVDLKKAERIISQGLI